MKSELHLLDVPKPKNKHIIFVDTKKEGNHLKQVKKPII